jgi:hypothetical protein
MLLNTSDTLTVEITVARRTQAKSVGQDHDAPFALVVVNGVRTYKVANYLQVTKPVDAVDRETTAPSFTPGIPLVSLNISLFLGCSHIVDRRGKCCIFPNLAVAKISIFCPAV